MQPSSPTKPVMDVAAPKSPVSVPNPNPFPQPQPPAPKASPDQSGALSVRPAPLASGTAPQPTAPLSPVPTSRRPVKKPAFTQAERRTPVALITVTAFVMLVLSVLAVAVYMTSKTA